MPTKQKLEKKYFSSYKKPLVDVPHLLDTQVDSYKWLVQNGLKEIFKEFSPIKDYSEKKFELEFTSFHLSEPKYDEYYAKANRGSYEAPLRAMVKLKNKTMGTSKEQEIFMADFPLMTTHGTFIINGVERVIVAQLARSFGVFFNENEIKGKIHFGAKVIPARGAWIEFESEADGIIYVRIDRKRKFPVTSLLRVFGLASDKDLLAAFKDSKTLASIQASIEKDTAKTAEESYIEIYKRLRDGDLATAENAKGFITSIFSEERYDLSPVGRFRLNKRFGKPMDEKALAKRTLSTDDLVEIITNIITLNNTPGAMGDDIDHLGSRRVRYVGEMLQQKIRMGMSQMKRNIQDRMSTIDAETTLPIQIVNQRPLQARIKEFFTTNQLSQFMGQENILTEVEHLRILSALGPGGLTRERAGFEVRDVHTSHYGRVCPIHTPEGQNIGLILHLSMYARTNDFGIIETPYIKVKNGKLTKEVVYLNALEEESYAIAHAGTPYAEDGRIIEEKVEARIKTEPGLVDRDKVDFIDVATNQAFSVATSMIPFLEHDDANRALMGSNMQKQATPVILPEAPLVATGIEETVAKFSGRLVMAQEAGTVSYADARKIVVKNEKGENEYALANFSRTNDFSSFHQRPSVSVGDKVKKGSEE
ncbi:MAG: DNA-directed RNA polymerase subunit beta, partial [Candidatus Paceibacterota bacterium]